MLTRLITYLRETWVLIDDYHYPEKGIRLSAAENRLRLAVHFLWPAFASLFLSYLSAPIIVKAAWAMLWGLMVFSREYRESAWQKPVKTRSDVVSKLAGLILLGLK